jgi:hypothetical protein
MPLGKRITQIAESVRKSQKLCDLSRLTSTLLSKAAPGKLGSDYCNIIPSGAIAMAIRIRRPDRACHWKPKLAQPRTFSSFRGWAGTLTGKTKGDTCPLCWTRPGRTGLSASSQVPSFMLPLYMDDRRSRQDSVVDEGTSTQHVS